MVIITDGEASDGDLLEAMKPLDDLPVLIVVKLCTDEQKVVDYWYYSPVLLLQPDVFIKAFYFSTW